MQSASDTVALPTAFAAELVPPAVHPVHDEVEMVADSTVADIHPDVRVPAWGYGFAGGPVTSPGPVLQVHAGRPVEVTWRNRIGPPGPLPFAYTEIDSAADNGDDSTQNRPGIDGGTARPTDTAPVGFLVTHLHGGHTIPDSDGWPDHMSAADGRQLTRYDNTADNADLGLDKVGALLWYHDHAMGATGLHVYAGLAGAYIVRDERERALGLPVGPEDGEAVLMIADRNLTEPDVDGELRFLHKTTSGADPTREFFGPLTLVGGKAWPRMCVGAGIVRLRLLNGSDSRTYRLHLRRDDQTLLDAQHVRIIGTDGGLLWRAAPVDPVAGIVLAPAERIDLLLDLTDMHGEQITILNSAPAPFSGGAADPSTIGTPSNADRLPFPEVMRLDVDAESGFCRPRDELWETICTQPLNPAFRRLVHDDPAAPAEPDAPPTFALPEDHEHQIVLLSESDPAGHLQLTDIMPDPDGRIELQLPNEQTPQRYRPVSSSFYDMIGVRPTLKRWQVWRFLNTTGDTHPIHIHQSTFQPLGTTGTAYAIDGYSQATHSTADGEPLAPARDQNGEIIAGRPFEPYETGGWKDTIRIDPGELVSVAIRFDIPGRYVYHCHILEHEDNEMMKPFVVMPVAGGMGGMDHM